MQQSKKPKNKTKQNKTKQNKKTFFYIMKMIVLKNNINPPTQYIQYIVSK